MTLKNPHSGLDPEVTNRRFRAIRFRPTQLQRYALRDMRDIPDVDEVMMLIRELVDMPSLGGRWTDDQDQALMDANDRGDSQAAQALEREFEIAQEAYAAGVTERDIPGYPLMTIRAALFILAAELEIKVLAYRDQIPAWGYEEGTEAQPRKKRGRKRSALSLELEKIPIGQTITITDPKKALKARYLAHPNGWLRRHGVILLTAMDSYGRLDVTRIEDEGKDRENIRQHKGDLLNKRKEAARYE